MAEGLPGNGREAARKEPRKRSAGDLAPASRRRPIGTAGGHGIAGLDEQAETPGKRGSVGRDEDGTARRDNAGATAADGEPAGLGPAEVDVLAARNPVAVAQVPGDAVEGADDEGGFCGLHSSGSPGVTLQRRRAISA